MSRSFVLLVCGIALAAGACDSPLGSVDADSRLLVSRYEENGSDIYSITPDGTGVVRLTSDPAREYCPRWSPDRERIAYVSERDSALLDGRLEVAPALWVMEADGSDPRPVVAGMPGAMLRCPDWSPDGTRLVFDRRVHGVAGSILHVVQADRQDVTPVAVAIGQGFSARWSPDGSSIAFLSQTPGWPRLTLAHADGHNRVQPPTPCIGYQGPPSWSPDGQRLAFACEAGRGQELFTARVDGTDAVRVVPPRPGVEVGAYEPVWSPDGRHIAFSRMQDAATGMDIHIVPSTGGFPVRITRTPGSEVMGDWR